MLARKTDGRLQIVLLDHGLYRKISDDFRCCSSVVGGANRDVMVTAQGSVMGWTVDPVNGRGELMNTIVSERVWKSTSGHLTVLNVELILQ